VIVGDLKKLEGPVCAPNLGAMQVIDTDSKSSEH
jgi:hypothetical protein